MKQNCFFAALILFSPPALAKLKVLTTTTDLRAITTEVGGEFIAVESIAKGTQDPHFIEAKPSFMVKANKADLLIAVGLELEQGWLPTIISGSRNPKINSGQRGYLEVGPECDPIEVAKSAVSRAQGDVHPLGNPHVTLDPIRAGQVAKLIAKRLGELDTAHAPEFFANAKTFEERMAAKVKTWSDRVTKSGVASVVTYHKTLGYFLQRFNLANPAILEPKPGIPPTSGHTIEVIRIIRDQKVPLILVENFFDPTVTKKIQQEAPKVRAVVVPVAVDGAPKVKTMDDLYEVLIKAVEGSK